MSNQKVNFGSGFRNRYQLQASIGRATLSTSMLHPQGRPTPLRMQHGALLHQFA
jgi:hypothetical protein